LEKEKNNNKEEQVQKQEPAEKPVSEETAKKEGQIKEASEKKPPEQKKDAPQGKRAPRRGGRPPAKTKTEGDEDFVEKVVTIKRVAKVVKGGRRFSFSATVVIGDGRATAGLGFGKANEVSGAIQKAFIDAKKNFFTVEKKGTTIPHEIMGHFKAANVLLKPGPEGTGVIAGGPARAVLEACGIKDVYAKSLGSNNPINVIKATINGLQQVRLKRR